MSADLKALDKIWLYSLYTVKPSKKKKKVNDKLIVGSIIGIYVN